MTVLGVGYTGVREELRHRIGSSWRSGPSDQMVADRHRDRFFRPVGDAQLGQEMGDVVLHGAAAEEKHLGDLAVGPPRDEQAQHLDLAVGEQGGRR